MSDYLLINNTAGDATSVTDSDVAIQGGTANNLPPSNYKAYEIDCDIELTTDDAVTEQTITYKIKLGSATITSVDVKPSTVASLQNTVWPIHIHYVSGYVGGAEVGNAIGAGGALTVTQVSTSVDADVTSIVKNLYVKGVS